LRRTFLDLKDQIKFVAISANDTIFTSSMLNVTIQFKANNALLAH